MEEFISIQRVNFTSFLTNIGYSERGIVEAIFDNFHNFNKIGQYLHGHNSIGLVLKLQKHSI